MPTRWRRLARRSWRPSRSSFGACSARARRTHRAPAAPTPPAGAAAGRPAARRGPEPVRRRPDERRHRPSPSASGPRPAARVIDFSLLLRLPDPAGVDAYLAGLYDPKSPDYHRFLTAAEYGARFGLPDERVEAVEDWARDHGLAVVERYAQRTAIRLRATADAVNRVFGITLVDEHDPATGVTYATLDRAAGRPRGDRGRRGGDRGPRRPARRLVRDRAVGLHAGIGAADRARPGRPRRGLRHRAPLRSGRLRRGPVPRDRVVRHLRPRGHHDVRGAVRHRRRASDRADRGRRAGSRSRATARAR